MIETNEGTIKFELFNDHFSSELRTTTNYMVVVFIRGLRKISEN